VDDVRRGRGCTYSLRASEFKASSGIIGDRETLL
jgi:hypothetical protein